MQVIIHSRPCVSHVRWTKMVTAVLSIIFSYDDYIKPQLGLISHEIKTEEEGLRGL